MNPKLVGIDAIQFAVPALYLPIPTLAENRGIEPAKLTHGLGLLEMAVCDVNQDAATLAADAAWQLIVDHKIQPAEIGRIYMGTESAVDAAKPTSTYVLGVLESRFESEFGARSLAHCDAVDLTFACVGGIDALHNASDWVRLGDNRKALVIASDVAIYDPNSPGEYTQGAGAVACWVTEKPRLATLSESWGVAVESVSDFFKPRRTFKKSELLLSAAKLLGVEVSEEEAEALVDSASEAFWGTPEAYIDQFREAPVFDGPYSNACYQNRVREALEMYRNQSGLHPLKDWSALIFHLPYAFQGRRMWPEIAFDIYFADGRLAELEAAVGESFTPQSRADFVKKWSKTNEYKTYVAEYIAPGEYASCRIGNMYTASIFMAFVSTLDRAQHNQHDLSGKTIGAMSYGSGSKSKVFSLEVQPEWKEAFASVDVAGLLDSRTAIDFSTYESLHQRRRETPVLPSNNTSLKGVEEEGVRKGYRLYQ